MPKKEKPKVKPLTPKGKTSSACGPQPKKCGPGVMDPTKKLNKK